MWYLNGIRQEVETTVSLFKQNQITDPKVLCNKDQITVIAQILKICDEDVEFLDQHIKKQSAMELKERQQEEKRLAQEEHERVNKVEEDYVGQATSRSKAALIQEHMRATAQTNKSNLENQSVR